MELPAFTGPAVALEPPFYFKNVTSCVFPLRAQLATLQRFCDSYLNLVPEELGRFHVAVPYVFLIMLDYGKMAAEASNFGWLSQREVLFCIPVEWYKWQDGKWVFHDWATVAPFIYVDDEISMTLGRTALGWPKSLVRLTPTLTSFLKHPSGTTTDVALSAFVLPKSYAGARMEERRVLTVRSPMYSSFNAPFRADNPFTFWTLWWNAANSFTDWAQDAMSMWQGLGLLPPNQAASLENLARKGTLALQAGMQSLPWALSLTANTINLKQFRRSDRTSEYCYQALVNGPMRFTAFNRGALLGRMNGDLSGGYIIDLVCWPNFPIVDALGLRAEMIESVEGPPIARLKPVMPLWYDVDMEYQRAETIAWRADDGHWRDAAGRIHRALSASATPTHSDLGASRDFNTTMGAASPVITGPFKFPAAKLTVLPLLARAPVLRELIDSTLNEPLTGAKNHERFELWAPNTPHAHAYVYLVVTDWGPMASETNSLGDWAEMCLTFYVPVRRWLNGQLCSGGLFAVQALARGTTQTCTFSELYGIPTLKAHFVAPPSAADRTYRQEPCTLLCVQAEMVPAVGEGQEVQLRTVVELRDGGDRAQLESSVLSDEAEAFCRLLSRELERKWALDEQAKQQGRVRALELLTLAEPVYVYTLKQFRDAARPQRACYQALTRVPYVLDEIQQIEEITRSMSIELRESAQIPLMRRLGLVARETKLVEGNIVYGVEAVRPFWMQVSLTLGDGERLQYRHGLPWVSAEQSEVPSGPRLTRELEELLGRTQRNHLKRGVAEYLSQRRLLLPASNETGDLAWLEQVDPQAVIESILSREWENRSSHSTLQTTREALARRLQRDEAGWGSWLADNLSWLHGLRHDATDPALALARLTDADLELVRWLRHLEHLSLVLSRREARSYGGSELHSLEAELDREHERTRESALDLWRAGDWLSAVASGAAPRALHGLVPQVIRDACREHARAASTLDFADAATRRAAAALVRRLLELLYPIAERRIEEALDAAVGRLRRPDHCVLRSLAGRERDRLYPLDRSWDHAWFQGLTRTELAARC